MKKIDAFLIENLASIKSAGYVKTLLREYNLHHIFSPLYENMDNPTDVDFLVVFIILAYTNKCTWLQDMEKDRRVVKLEIVNSILLDSGIHISDEVELVAVKSTGDVFDSVLEVYLNSQKNRLFSRFISLSELISRANKMGMSNTNIKYNELKSLVDSTNNLEDTERQLEDVRQQIEREYSMLDEALKKEGRRPLSKDFNIFKYEEMLTNRRKVS